MSAKKTSLPDIKDAPPAPKMKAPATATMEVPQVMMVRIRDGILLSADERGSDMSILFKHVHESMNNRNCLPVLDSLAKHHGVEVKVEE